MKRNDPLSMESPVVVIGAGPAGLTAGYELARQGRAVIVFEQDRQVGGLAKTVEYKGYRFDIGGHRFFTKIETINGLWHTILGKDLLVRSRKSRILYHGRYYDYPLRPLNALRNLGLVASARVLLSYCWAKLRPVKPEVSFADWVSNRFGRELYATFFKSYTEKVWGISCTVIRAQWAAQRIKGLSLWTTLLNMVLPGFRRGRKGTIKTLISEFSYPRLGPGMMWKALAERIEQYGGTVKLSHRITRVLHEGDKIIAIEVDHDGQIHRQDVSHVMSSMPLRTFILALLPVADEKVLEAVYKIKYRDFITVALVIDEAELFPDNWLYIHDESVQVGRIQNYKNWSPEMVPDRSKTCLGMEYFCAEGDALWGLSDRDLIALATRELFSLGLVAPHKIIDGTVVRVPKAYPVYDEGFEQSLGVVRRYLEGFKNLQEIGRNGLHKYNNMDHSMLTGILAVQNLYGKHHDLWTVNADEEYLEEESITTG